MNKTMYCIKTGNGAWSEEHKDVCDIYNESEEIDPHKLLNPIELHDQYIRFDILQNYRVDKSTIERTMYLIYNDALYIDADKFLYNNTDDLYYGSVKKTNNEIQIALPNVLTTVNSSNTNTGHINHRPELMICNTNQSKFSSNNNVLNNIYENLKPNLVNTTIDNIKTKCITDLELSLRVYKPINSAIIDLYRRSYQYFTRIYKNCSKELPGIINSELERKHKELVETNSVLCKLSAGKINKNFIKNNYHNSDYIINSITNTCKDIDMFVISGEQSNPLVCSAILLSSNIIPKPIMLATALFMSFNFIGQISDYII